MRLLPFGLLLCLLIGSRTASLRPLGDTPELAALRSTFVALYNAGDTTGMGGLYTTEAVRMPYDAPGVTGRESIVTTFAKAFAGRQLVPTLVLTAEEVHVADTVAMERGTYHEVLRRRTGDVVATEDGKYVALVRKSSKGWQYHWSIFNRDGGRR